MRDNGRLCAEAAESLKVVQFLCYRPRERVVLEILIKNWDGRVL